MRRRRPGCQTGPVTTILSIQSSVAFGHVGNSAAVFPMQRRGVEVWPVNTVQFSNNTSYESWRGPLLAATDVSEIVTGIDELGVLDRVDAVLSGYQGAEDVGASILAAVDLVQQRNPSAFYCCDPVMGDEGRGFYVRPGIPQFMRDEVVPRARVVTPNQFELNFLVGRQQTPTLTDILSAADELRAEGPQTVLVTSALHDDLPPETVSMVAVTADGAWEVRTPRIDHYFTGTGDMTAACFLSDILTAGDVAAAAQRTAATVYGVLEVTAATNERELQLIPAQDEIVNPSNTFETIRIR